MNKIIVDPNSVAHKHPMLSVAIFEDAQSIPETGDKIIVSQPYDDEPDYIGDGVVHSVDHQHGLIYIDVDWKSFREEIL